MEETKEGRKPLKPPAITLCPVNSNAMGWKFLNEAVLAYQDENSMNLAHYLDTAVTKFLAANGIPSRTVIARIPSIQSPTFS